jgi:hypothetical protein
MKLYSSPPLSCSGSNIWRKKIKSSRYTPLKIGFLTLLISAYSLKIRKSVSSHHQKTSFS